MDNPTLIAVITLIGSVLTSSGFWIYLNSRVDKEAAEKKMLIGLGHDRLLNLSLKYINRGYITNDEYENLMKYLFKPYKTMGGNGTIDRIIKEVDKLPIKQYSNDQKIKDTIDFEENDS